MSLERKVNQNNAQKADDAAALWAYLQHPADGANVLVSGVSFGC
jgi:hypothetical protein